MDLNQLLSAKGIDSKTSRVLVMRHTPKEPELRKALPWLASDKHDVFNCYQQFQRPREEKKLAAAAYVASFIGRAQGEAVFVGVYSVRGSRPVLRKRFWQIPENAALRRLGLVGWRRTDHRTSGPRFDLKLTDVYSEWKGRLVIAWPPPEISWARWLHRSEFTAKAILEESVLDERIDAWDELVLTWEQLRQIPRRLVDRLKEWRGVYFIHDASDGKGYVGSAYGEQNLYGRWIDYAARGDGGNRLLSKRNPKVFRFSILQLAEPTALRDDVIRLESKWKTRLHTRERKFGLNLN